MQFQRILLLAAVLLGLASCGGGGSSATGPNAGPPPPPPPPTNQAPVATGTSVVTSEIVDVTGAVSATDADGDVVAFTVSTPPTKGVVSAFDSATGNFTYSPDVTQDGFDSFGVTASDASEESAEVTVDIEIFKWAGTQQFGSTVDDYATTGGLYRTVDGGFIFGGSTDGQISTTSKINLQDAWLRKVDRRGNELWTVQYGSPGNNNSRIIVAAPDGSGTFVIVDTSGGAAVYKFDSDGTQLLESPIDFQGAAINYGAYWGAVDGNGDLYVLSRTGQMIVSAALTKVDGSTGDTLWQRRLEGTSEPDPTTTAFSPDWSSVRLHSIDFDSAGNAIVLGQYRPDPNAAARPCSTCPFILRYDSNGNLLGATELNSFPGTCPVGRGYAYRVSVAPDDTLWAVGMGNFTSPNGDSFGQVARYNADGSQELWSYCDVTGTRNSLYFTPVLFAANGEGVVYGIVQSPSGTPINSSDLVITRLDEDGNVVFRREIAGTKIDGNPAISHAGSIVEDSQGLLYITGATDGEFVPGAAEGGNDILLLRMDADGNPR